MTLRARLAMWSFPPSRRALEGGRRKICPMTEKRPLNLCSMALFSLSPPHTPFSSFFSGDNIQKLGAQEGMNESSLSQYIAGRPHTEPNKNTKKTLEKRGHELFSSHSG